MYVDKQETITLVNNRTHHQRSKHIDVKYHFVRLEIRNGVLELAYTSTDNNVADIFTKPVTRAKLERLVG